MGNTNSAESPRQKDRGQQNDSVGNSSRRKNRLSKPRLGASPQTPISAALSRTLSTKVTSQSSVALPTSRPLINQSNSHIPIDIEHVPSPGPVRRPPSIDLHRRSNSLSGYYNRTSSEVLTHTYNHNVDTSSNLQKRSSFTSIQKRNSFQRHDGLNPGFLDVALKPDDAFPPTTASSTASSYHSAAQSPTKAGCPSRQNSFHASDDNFKIPVRRRSLLMAAAPGTASRPKPFPRATGNNMTTDSTLSKLVALDLANPAGIRSETPNDLESLGSFKRGSLFVTNGAPSPVPSSPDMRSVSWGSQHKRSPSLPNLPSLANLPTLNLEDPPPLPTIRPAGDERFFIPRKPVGSSRNVSGGTLRNVSSGSAQTVFGGFSPTKLDTKFDALILTPNAGVRLIPHSPVRSIKSSADDSASDYDVNDRDVSGSEDEDNKPMEFVASIKPLPRRTSAAKISIKDRPSSAASRSATSPTTTPAVKPVTNPIDSITIPEKSSRRSMDTTTPIIKTPLSITPHYNTFSDLVVHDHPSPEQERQVEMKVLLPMNIVVGTVAETVPDRSRTPSLDLLTPAPLTIRKSSQPPSPAIPITEPSGEATKHQRAILDTAEALEGNTRANLHPDTAQKDQVGADSGYSSSESYMIPPPKSWRRSKSINPQTNDTNDDAIVDVVEIDYSEHSAAEEPVKPQRPPMAITSYSSANDKSSPRIQESTTPKKSRSFFSRKSSERTPEINSPKLEESPKKPKKSRRLSFRRLGSRTNKEEPFELEVEVPHVNYEEIQASPDTAIIIASENEIVPEIQSAARTEKAEPKSPHLSVARSISTLDLDSIVRSNEARLSNGSTAHNVLVADHDKPAMTVLPKRKSVPRVSHEAERANTHESTVAYEPIALTSSEQSRPSHALKTASSVSYTGSTYYQRFSTPSPGPSALTNLANQYPTQSQAPAQHQAQLYSPYQAPSDVTYNPEPQYIQDNHDYSRTSNEIPRPTIPVRKRPQSYSTGQGQYTPPRPKSLHQANTYQDTLPFYGSSPPLRSATKSPPSSYKFNNIDTPTPTPPLRPKTAGSRPASIYGPNGGPPAFALEGGAYPRMSRESQTWGVDFGDIPVLRAEDLVQGYGNVNGKKAGAVDDSDDEDEEPSSRSRQKTSFWSRGKRSKSKPRMAI